MNTLRCRINGHEAHVSLAGPQGAPVVMLAHSILADLSMWDEVCLGLQDRWRVVRYDLRGHGRSSAPAGPCSMAVLGGDAIALIDTLGLGPVHFVGASLGGMLGQWLAATHGERLLSLTLSNTAARQVAPQAWSDRIDRARSEGVEALADATLQRWFSSAFLQYNHALVQKTRAAMLTTSLAGFTGCAQAVRSLDQLALLSAITVPTLVLGGESDLATPVALSREIALRIPHARLIEMPRGVHMSPVERPADYVACVRDFLESTSLSGVPE